jgi:hypothetical protein
MDSSSIITGLSLEDNVSSVSHFNNSNSGVVSPLSPHYNKGGGLYEDYINNGMGEENNEGHNNNRHSPRELVPKEPGQANAGPCILSCYDSI